ncbi:iron chelate uptake ABC transporter family permease subunit [Acaricomes phytoseiuli]|nr:iron chelate uptake ABC transporter family permease subunit [Acaricomes phytoseiuli]MCW1250486.1 iron chelate uptake ABC transporter family permease subunit [Acaricomes phytoseiuli]
MVGAGLGAVVLGLFAILVLLGRFMVSVPDFFAILFGENIPGASFIVMESKLPRALLGALVGAAFGAAGLIFQTLLRNPLASPDIIGISSGASASAVLAIVLFAAGGTTVSVLAIVGAVIVALLISMLSRQHHGQQLERPGSAGSRLILIGIAIAAMAQAVVIFLMQRAEFARAQEALVWTIGSLNPANWERVGALFIGLAVLAPFVIGMATRLGILQLGDDAAAGLGVRVGRSRMGLILLGVVLAALATAAAGPVAFVSFLAGPISRRLLQGRVNLAVAALVGAAIVLAGEFIATNLIPGGPLPVGVVTGAAGAPFLLWLLIRSNRRENSV